MENLYLIRCNEFYKIGIANDLQSRLASLQTGNPYPLMVAACFEFDSAAVVEKALHQKFSSVRRRGEWFELGEKEYDEFLTLCEMLGGVGVPGWGKRVDEEEIEEAEEVQETMLDNQGMDEEYDIQIQGADRTYPAVILRRKGRGAGATIRTISKFGKYAHLYDNYKKEIEEYLKGKSNE